MCSGREPYEDGWRGPGWRMLIPSQYAEVQVDGHWVLGVLRQWQHRPDGWYGYVRWGDEKEPRWVHQDQIRPAEPPTYGRTRR